LTGKPTRGSAKDRMSTVQKPPKADTNWIGLLALFISVTALWESSLAPANIKATLGSPEFKLGPMTAAEKGTLPNGTQFTRTSSLVLMATCAFANNGATTGEIRNIAVQFVADDGTKWIFLPYRLLDGLRSTDQDGSLSIDSAKAPPFSPILIPGKQTAVHTFLFIPSGFDTLTPHKFEVKFFIWFGDDKKPHKQQVSTLNLTDDMVSVISNGNLTALPFEEEKPNVNDLE